MIRPYQIQDFYQRLGINPSASNKEIKSAYRKLAKQYHPDIVGDSIENLLNFTAIKEAYKTLSDKEKRRVYDSSLRRQNATKPRQEQSKTLEQQITQFKNTYNWITLDDIQLVGAKVRRINFAIFNRELNAELRGRTQADLNQLLRIAEQYEVKITDLFILAKDYEFISKSARRAGVDIELILQEIYQI